MAGKGKQKVDLQIEVKNQEEWDALMAKSGLVVVDVYANWCGPCKAILGTFRKLKNELGDEFLNFATASTDDIESLAAYRGKSKPTFLFYGSGELRAVVRGCNVPLLTTTVINSLKKEHQIMDGAAERDLYIDKETTGGGAIIEEQNEKNDGWNKDKCASEEEEEVARKMHERVLSAKVKSDCQGSPCSFDDGVQKEVVVAIIKPDAVQAGLVDEILREIKAAGVEILHQEERTLSRQEAAEFYKQHEGAEHFEQLIEFMSSGPCMTLVLSKCGDDSSVDLIPKVRNLIGPSDVNKAKEQAPTSIRARFGKDSLRNAFHACDSSESAARELAFFFPDFKVPHVQAQRKKTRLQRTLALIRPNAVRTRKNEILQKIHEAGFLIAMEKDVQLTRAQAEEFYSQHKDKPYFESLVTTMTSGPSLALCLAREDAVQVWRDMLGPKEVDVARNKAPESLRAQFALPDDSINPIHGAESENQVQKEMRILFPPETTVAVIKPDLYEKHDEKEAVIRKIKEAGFHISAQKEVNLTKDLAAMFYKEHKGKEFFEPLIEYMSSGPSQFLILSREDAVHGFRALMGPTKPDEARRVNPNSLRAQYATDAMKNAVHGSSNVEKAKTVIMEFFPEIHLNPDGTVADISAREDGVERVKPQASGDSEGEVVGAGAGNEDAADQHDVTHRSDASESADGGAECTRDQGGDNGGGDQALAADTSEGLIAEQPSEDHQTQEAAEDSLGGGASEEDSNFGSKDDEGAAADHSHGESTSQHSPDSTDTPGAGDDVPDPVPTPSDGDTVSDNAGMADAEAINASAKDVSLEGSTLDSDQDGADHANTGATSTAGEEIHE